MDIVLWVCVGFNLSLTILHATNKRWGMAAVGIGLILFCAFGALYTGIK